MLSRQSLEKLREKARKSARTNTVNPTIVAALDLGDRCRSAKTLKFDQPIQFAFYFVSFCLPFEADQILFYVEVLDGDYLQHTDSSLQLKRGLDVTGPAGEPSVVRMSDTDARADFQDALRTWEQTLALGLERLIVATGQEDRQAPATREVPEAGNGAEVDRASGATAPFSATDLEALRARAIQTPGIEGLSAQDARAFGIGSQAFTGRRVTYTAPGGTYSMTFLAVPGADDVLLVAETRGATHLYLTDHTMKLRAAAVREPGGLRLLTNAQAEAGYDEVLRVWAQFRER